jgi:hypothetical protein
MEFGRIVLEKMEIGESFFGKNHGKSAHWRNLAPKIIYDFDCISLDSFYLKLEFWVVYVDGTNVKWPHSKENLDKFMEHLNSQSKHIQFTMELEDNNSIPFLDVHISSKEDVSLGHQVNCKKLHTEKYLLLNLCL